LYAVQLAITAIAELRVVNGDIVASVESLAAGLFLLQAMLHLRFRDYISFH